MKKNNDTLYFLRLNPKEHINNYEQSRVLKEYHLDINIFPHVLVLYYYPILQEN